MARFKRPARNHRKRAGLRGWLLLWRTPALLGIVLAAWWFVFRPESAEQAWVAVDFEFAACGEPWEGKDGCAVDGDTLVIGNGGKRRRIRLTGFDAPEIEGACEAERNAAVASRAALLRWLAKGRFEWDGGAEPPRDQYGRELRAARRTLSNGRHETLEHAMVSQRLGSRSGWGQDPIDWCA